MIVAIHKVNGKKIVAVSDSEIIGKKFEEGNKQIDLTADFYKGEEKSEDEIVEMIKDAYIVQFTGEKSIGFGIKNKIIGKENIIKISGIPHAEGIIVME